MAASNSASNKDRTYQVETYDSDGTSCSVATTLVPKCESFFDDELTHMYRGESVICATDSRGHAMPGGKSPLEIVVDASEGFIPLWAPDTTLRWRFQPQSMSLFVNPEGAKEYLRWLLGQGLTSWGNGVPVRFTEANEAWDFEIAVSANPSCNASGGCTLARAFFPDSGRHDLLLYPTMFEQSEQEQVETMAHELGHIFGLRHFFAPVSETEWAAEIFGVHNSFSIMNYGARSVMTQADRDDLRELYERVWSGGLMAINGTPVRLVRPFSAGRVAPPECVPVGSMAPPAFAQWPWGAV